MLIDNCTQASGAIGLHGAYFGEGQGHIFLDNVECSPCNHSSLIECFTDEIGIHDCLHSEDASVICPGEYEHHMFTIHSFCLTYNYILLPLDLLLSSSSHKSLPANNAVPHLHYLCDNGAIRIVGGESELEGRVEVCLSGVWGSICGVDWTDLNAAVVCNQSGFAITGESSKKYTYSI